MSRLFDEDQTPPSLRAQKCGACGFIRFPPNPYGCEQCGATDGAVTDCRLRGEGKLRAFATTYHASRKDQEVPYTVASIELVDGPVIRVMMAEPTDAELAVGVSVRSILNSAAKDGASDGDQLRFTLAAAS